MSQQLNTHICFLAFGGSVVQCRPRTWELGHSLLFPPSCRSTHSSVGTRATGEPRKGDSPPRVLLTMCYINHSFIHWSFIQQVCLEHLCSTVTASTLPPCLWGEWSSCVMPWHRCGKDKGRHAGSAWEEEQYQNWSWLPRSLLAQFLFALFWFNQWFPVETTQAPRVTIHRTAP